MHFNISFRKYILLWALAAMVVGYLVGRFNPERVSSLRFLLTPLLFIMVFLMVFPTDLSLLYKLRNYAMPIIVSFILTILSPVLGILISRIIPVQFVFLRNGLIISSTVPPNAMLSAWTAFLEGDVLLTLIIQSFTFIYYLILVPFGLKALLLRAAPFSIVILARNLFLLIVIPFGLAGGLKYFLRRHLKEDIMRRIRPTLSSISGMIELFIILISIALRAEILTMYPVIIWWGVLSASIYYAAGFMMAWMITALFKLDREISVPLIYQNGSKNLSIAMVIVITTFETRAILGVAACVLAQFPISALFYTIFVRRYESGRYVKYNRV